MNAPADPSTQESALAAHWRFIPDPHERLALATQAAAGPGLPSDLKSGVKEYFKAVQGVRAEAPAATKPAQ
jgi:hypothetical protein